MAILELYWVPLRAHFWGLNTWFSFAFGAYMLTFLELIPRRTGTTIITIIISMSINVITIIILITIITTITIIFFLLLLLLLL